MRCVVFGATGYLGVRLVAELLSAGHDVRVMARQPAKLDDVPWRRHVDVVEGDVSDGEQVRRALEGQQVLYYLVHSLLRSDFVDFDARAASIIGAGSASFEILRYLTERLPLMVTPRWLRTQVQPISVGDVLYYLVNAAELPPEVNRAFDIGGPDTFTYTEMIRKYAAIAGLQRRIAIPVPVLTPWLSSHWVNLITPLPRALASS